MEHLSRTDQFAEHPADPADRALLASVQAALETPFRDPVRVCGQLMPRKLARQIERNLLRLCVMERRAEQIAA